MPRCRKRKYTTIEQHRQVKNDLRTQRKKTSSNGIDSLSCIATNPDILPTVLHCQFCDAKRIYSEPPGFCCSSGEIKLSETIMPHDLVNLYTSNSDDAKHFRQYTRGYNNMFAFTSLGVHYDKSLAIRNNGVYTFRVQGQLHHYIDQLFPSNNENPKHLQLYFFDTEHEVSNRMLINSNFRESLVNKLITILDTNPYAKFFRNLISYSDLNDYKITLELDPVVDERVYNKPTTSQVAGIWLESNTENTDISPHIQVYSKDGKSQIIKHYFGCYDPLEYPLIFPNGEPGWRRNIERLTREVGDQRLRNTSATNLEYNVENYMDAETLLTTETEGVARRGTWKKHVSCREYYCYKLQMRENDQSYLLHIGRLLQQYVIDMYIKIETSRLDFYKNDEMQNRLRKEVYQGLVDSVAHGCQKGSQVGKRIILPTSFIGGPRDMRKRYMDALTLVQRYGKPDIFLTITTNPNWPEIKSFCLPSDETQNRPDIIARVFHAKLEVLKSELFKKKIFGNVIAYTYVIEFQKRGLPHAHFLLILDNSSKIYAPEAFDTIVSAELPNPDNNSYLFKLVKTHMIHGPCGDFNPKCPCMKYDIERNLKYCKFKYPREFSETTKYGDNSYPIYRRRNTGFSVNIRGSHLDNRWVVPYNPYLLSKFNCHVNVEICSTIQAVKYIYKYIYKGHDKISYTLSTDEGEPVFDEIKNFQRARWISAPEAIWRIFSFELNHIQPSVISLPVHLENEQTVSFTNNNSLNTIINNPKVKSTMLTQFFHMNRYNENAQSKNCLYVEFPEYFTWHKSSKEWKPRKKRDVVGRILTCHPSEGERFYLRLLLMHIRRPTSFEQLRTIKGKTFTTFREAAQTLGLMEDDSTSEQCLIESIKYLMPAALRQLFATILIYCSPNNPKELWIKFEDHLSEDFNRDKSLSPELVKHKTLEAVVYHLYSMGKRIEDFPFIDDLSKISTSNSITKELQAEQNIITPHEDIVAVAKLNKDQKFAYDRILHHVNNNIPKVFFIDGPGGTGKTFLYKALLATVRSGNQIALATATSGVAASLLPGGRTSHSRFKIPLDENDSRSCNISKQSTLAHLIKLTRLIIWDEATMAKRSTIEKFDEMLRDIMDSNDIFGGKIIVFGGDFRQTLPVVTRGSKEDIIDASIVMSPLWNRFEKLKLHQNMRALLDTQFSSYLLKIGNGTENADENGEIQIPSKANIHFEDDESSLHKLIDAVFPNINYDSEIQSFVKRAILTTRNDFVHEINDTLIDMFPGEEYVYLSNDENANMCTIPDQQELFHSLTPPGLPPHKLILKKNAPIILLRNLNPTEGLCNGTRLICKDFSNNIIYAEISTGSYVGKPVFIPRITLESSQNGFSSVPFKRKQFPIRLCFAMTINKAQGQTLDYVGIYLKEPVFSHGQLYVALSRAKTIDQLKVLIRPASPQAEVKNRTKNIVYDEVLVAAKIK